MTTEWTKLKNNPITLSVCGYSPSPKPKLTTVWEGDSLDILARESIEGLTKHQPKGKSRYGTG